MNSSAPRVRILSGSAVAMGPGKADLLRSIDETGSISGAARRMGMSYRRAWLLVQTMNECFRSPLVDAEKGGTQGGGARLTPLGRDVLARYQELVQLAGDRFGSYLASARTGVRVGKARKTRRALSRKRR